MALHPNDSQRQPIRSGGQMTPGWTKMHSWVFLGVVAVGFLLILVQNRYSYLMPPAAGTAYRVSKIFGSIEEFNPSAGWVSAQLGARISPQASVMPEAPPFESQAVPMRVPAGAKPEVAPPQRKAEVTPAPPERRDPSASVKEQTLPPPRPKETTKPEPAGGKEEQYQLFVKIFPDYGEAEFQLAREDLFPDWRKRVAPRGTWPQFIEVYKEFVDWWVDQGSPADSGFKLWQDFLVATGKLK
ncbi:MAG: hypothetical protein FJ118_07630 [Deltaproteobacteria bacterium]|nr:hypothetical protein [Deltaproteobacteria bacterium]